MYPVIRDEKRYKEVTDIFFESMEISNPKNIFYTPQFIELHKRLELETIVASTLGDYAMPNLNGNKVEDIVDKHFRLETSFENGTLLIKGLNPFEKADVVRYHLFELVYISCYSILENFILEICIKIINCDGSIRNKTHLIKDLSFKGFYDCIKFLDKKISLGSTELLNTVDEDIKKMQYRRNCIVHNLGIIEEYNYEKMGYSKLQIGNKVMIDFEEVMKYQFIVYKTARLIDITVIKLMGEKYWKDN